jgi:inner membrane protein
MSSFIGHSLAAYTLFSVSRGVTAPSLKRAAWLGWFIVLASAPDIDYLVPALAHPANGGLRITHSIALSLVVPLLTILVLFLSKVSEERQMVLSICLILTGLSHLALDFLVGVTPLPLLWPVDPTVYSSPLGILPSAGRIQFSNYYLYRNVLIEVGVLAPLMYVARDLYVGAGGSRNWLRILILLLIASCFAAWSINLNR